MATPYLCRPIEHGADIVIHSATKFLGGHGTTLGGVVVESGRFDWGNGRFPQMTEPVPSYGGLNWWGNFGEYGFLTKLRAEQLRDIGASLSPAQRVPAAPGGGDAAAADGRPRGERARVAEWLDADPRVSWVRVGRAARPPRPRARRGATCRRAPVRCSRSGSRAAGTPGRRFIESVQLCSHLANIGDARTLVLHPGSTTHQQLTDRAARDAGVPADLVRISVGLEDVDDILWDLDQALAAAAKDAMHDLGEPDRERSGSRSCATPGRSRWSAPRPTRRGPATSSPPTCCASTGYEVCFVNPNADEILGRPVYPSLADLPGVPDLVDVFRRPEDLPAVLDDVLAVDGVRVFWTQFGLFDEAVAALREAAGLQVVMDRCLKVEHARFHGGLHLAGFDTGVISSRRRPH